MFFLTAQARPGLNGARAHARGGGRAWHIPNLVGRSRGARALLSLSLSVGPISHPAGADENAASLNALAHEHPPPDNR